VAWAKGQSSWRLQHRKRNTTVVFLQIYTILSISPLYSHNIIYLGSRGGKKVYATATPAVTLQKKIKNIQRPNITALAIK
jgi:hypothetical protein